MEHLHPREDADDEARPEGDDREHQHGAAHPLRGARHCVGHRDGQKNANRRRCDRHPHRAPHQRGIILVHHAANRVQGPPVLLQNIGIDIPGADGLGFIVVTRQDDCTIRPRQPPLSSLFDAYCLVNGGFRMVSNIGLLRRRGDEGGGIGQRSILRHDFLRAIGKGGYPSANGTPRRIAGVLGGCENELRLGFAVKRHHSPSPVLLAHCGLGPGRQDVFVQGRDYPNAIGASHDAHFAIPCGSTKKPGVRGIRL